TPQPRFHSHPRILAGTLFTKRPQPRLLIQATGRPLRPDRHSIWVRLLCDESKVSRIKGASELDGIARWHRTRRYADVGLISRGWGAFGGSSSRLSGGADED